MTQILTLIALWCGNVVPQGTPANDTFNKKVLQCRQEMVDCVNVTNFGALGQPNDARVQHCAKKISTF